MTRVHMDTKARRNLVTLRYRTTMKDRPSDRVLALLLKTFTIPDMAQSLGNRRWILQQEQDGWTLALEVRNGRDCCFVVPGAAQDRLIGKKLDLGNPRQLVETVRSLWHDADDRIADPAHIPTESLQALVRDVSPSVTRSNS